MRTLLRSVLAKASPAIAVALLAGCQQQDSTGSQASEVPQASEASRASEVPQVGAVQQPQLSELAEACGFKCKVIADGEANISGVREVDAFFSATLALKDQAALLKGEIEGSLGEIAGILGVEAGANIDATATNIAAEISGGFNGSIDGGLTVHYKEPQCSVSAQASVEAAAKCDAQVDPGNVEVDCKGECVAEANVMASCEGNATLSCHGTAPSFACEGSCEGSCELNAGVQCEGTCQGTCQLDGTAACDGTCMGTEEGGMCNGECQVRAGGKCEGECKGSCELTGGATCEGQCKGECTYTAPEGGCTGGARASCSGSANASVKCKGECKGDVDPPMVKAECKASAKAEAQFHAECTPPELSVDYNLSAEFAANGSVDAKAALSAKIEAFGKAYAKLLAKGARIKGIVTATAALPEAGADAVTSAAQALTTSGDIQVAFQATCAVNALPAAATAINGARTDLQASGSAVTKVTASLGG